MWKIAFIFYYQIYRGYAAKLLYNHPVRGVIQRAA